MFLAALTALAADGDPIRLRAPRAAATIAEADGATTVVALDGRRGFDYEAFRGRLESLWFQRTVFLSAGRDSDAATQSQLIRAFCAEEGVRRLDDMAAALLLEARMYQREGSYSKAGSSLEFAEFFGPGSATVHRARAGLLWASGAGMAATAAEAAAAVRAALIEQWRDLSLANHLLLVLLTALLVCATVFTVLLLALHQSEVRHDVDERLKGTRAEPWHAAIGWAFLLLPCLVWVGSGWAVFYWIAILFRYLRRAERVAAVLVLLLLAASPPAFRAAVAFRAMTEDPMVRTTMASADGAYEPERVVKLQHLVESHPDDPTYRFLLARLYANGHYFEEAFAEYKRVLALDPQAFEAYVNVGNILFRLGQYGEAVVQYRRAIDSRPQDVLAYYDAYVTHSEWFRFKEAQEYLDKGTALDAEGMAQLLSDSGRPGGRMTVVDATVDLSHVWISAMEGKPLRGIAPTNEAGGSIRIHAQSLWNPWSGAALLALVACGVSLHGASRFAPARACLRCGRPFCPLCKSEREKGKEYCTQCLHLFVLGDGLSAETKTRKLYEVDRHARIMRMARRAVTLLLPGGAEILSGRPFRGCAVLFSWVVALVCIVPNLVAPLSTYCGFDVHLGLLRPTVTPAWADLDAAAAAGILLAFVAWTGANVRILLRREA